VVPSNRVCKDCRKACPVAGEVMLRGCTEFSDIICKSDVQCTCPNGNYISKPCQGIEPARCTRVSFLDGICPTGFYRAAVATNVSDINCTMCPQSCPSGYFQKSPPPPTSKLAGWCLFECQPCGSCPNGLWRELECNATSDVQCGPCLSSDCGGAEDGQRYINEPCWDRMPSTCNFCTQPPSSGYHVPPENACRGRNDSVPVKCQ
jgi:hypothetical protein